jgi:hypothetical protein
VHTADIDPALRKSLEPFLRIIETHSRDDPWRGGWLPDCQSASGVDRITTGYIDAGIPVGQDDEIPPELPGDDKLRKLALGSIHTKIIRQEHA